MMLSLSRKVGDERVAGVFRDQVWARFPAEAGPVYGAGGQRERRSGG